jgi:hypothetical protein
MKIRNQVKSEVSHLCTAGANSSAQASVPDCLEIEIFETQDWAKNHQNCAAGIAFVIAFFR